MRILVCSGRMAAMWLSALAFGTAASAQLAPPPYGPVNAITETASPSPTLAASPAQQDRYARASGLRVGDLVRVRSGGPLMTVRAVEGSEAVCDWQTWAGEPRSARFQISELNPIGGPGYVLSPPSEPKPYRPCKADVAVNGRDECIN
jgi:uncharacterized protein YodC (DUF2158 family)